MTLRRGVALKDEPLPVSLIPTAPLPTWVQRDAVLRFAKDQEQWPALVEILERRPPRARLDAGVIEAAASLDGSYLFVQGPPGSGKTWLGARMAIELMRRGQRVGVTSLSHKAIHKFLRDVRDAALEQGFEFKGRKKCSGDPETEYEDEFVDCSDANEDLRDEELQLVAGTSFLFSREDQSVDTLFVDEAGQVSLADVLAVGTAARNVVLLGDPNQLAQVSQGSHPPGANASVLQHLLGGDETLRAGDGPLPRRDLADAAGGERVHLDDVLRGAARAGSGVPGALARGRERDPLPAGRARGEPDAVAGGGGRRSRRRSSGWSGRRTRTSTASASCGTRT